MAKTDAPREKGLLPVIVQVDPILSQEAKEGIT